MVDRVNNSALRSSDREPAATSRAVEWSGDQERGAPDRLDAGLLKITSVCVLAAIMTILDTTVVNVAQRTFIVEFPSTQAIVAWTATGYTLALAAVIPLTGWAADRFGTKRLFIGSIVLFTAGSLLCAMAGDITQLITYRVVAGTRRRHAYAPDVHHPDARGRSAPLGRLMAVLGIPMLLGPVGGPILGGWLIGATGGNGSF